MPAHNRILDFGHTSPRVDNTGEGGISKKEKPEVSEEKIAPKAHEAQSPQENSKLKRGTEVVKSVELASNFFRISRRRRSFGFPVFLNDDAWLRRVAEASAP